MSDNLLGFNYDVLDEDVRDKVRQHASGIHELLEKTTANIIEIGRQLIEVKRQMGKAHFQAWLKVEFRWTHPVASNFMRIAEKFGQLDCVAHFQPSALYALARDKVDERAVSDAIDTARSGEVVTKKRANELVAKYTPPGRATAKPDVVLNLRSAMKQVSGNVDQLLIQLGREQLVSLADDLLDLALRLRTAGRQVRTEPTADHPESNGRRANRNGKSGRTGPASKGKPTKPSAAIRRKSKRAAVHA